MKITKRSGPPEDLVYFDDELDLKEKDVEDVVEIFNTPLTGSYNWDYTVAENRIKKLYELGKVETVVSYGLNAASQAIQVDLTILVILFLNLQILPGEEQRKT